MVGQENEKDFHTHFHTKRQHENIQQKTREEDTNTFKSTHKLPGEHGLEGMLTSNPDCLSWW